jgi:hypothetical protein
MRTLFLVVVTFAIAAAEAKDLYRCETEGKVTYTDTPCKAGRVIHAPELSPAERANAARARQKLDGELEQRRISEEIGRRYRAEVAAAEAEQRATQAASRAEAARRANLEARLTAAEQQIQLQARSRSSGNVTAPVPPPTFLDQRGNFWLNHGGTAFNPATGRTCVQAGGQLVNCF